MRGGSAAELTFRQNKCEPPLAASNNVGQTLILNVKEINSKCQANKLSPGQIFFKLQTKNQIFQQISKNEAKFRIFRISFKLRGAKLSCMTFSFKSRPMPHL